MDKKTNKICSKIMNDILNLIKIETKNLTARDVLGMLDGLKFYYNNRNPWSPK